MLVENQDKFAGQINSAAKAPILEALSGMIGWLDGQIHKLDVDVRTGAEAMLGGVIAEHPDVVIIATGGRPNLNEVKHGSELRISTWDLRAKR